MFIYLHKKVFLPAVKLPLLPTSTPIPTFSIEKAPSKSVQAQIISLSGDVNWQSRTATQPAAITSPIPVKQGEVVSTGDTGKAEVHLNDDSFSLLPKTHLEFIQTLPQNFVLNQASGTVTYTHNSNVPLSVRSLHLLVQMEKGVAILSVDTDTHIITLDIQKGSAQVGFNDSSLFTTLQTVAKGEELIYDDDKREITVKELP
jgi:hypothetical protein